LIFQPIRNLYFVRRNLPALIYLFQLNP
jgi:hypothetical protein